jgi:penicillin-binding protein 2
MSFAGFMTDEISNNSRAYCDGSMSLPRSSRQFRCHKRSGHGTVNPETALAKSCDIFYYQLALGLGIDRIEDSLGQFGFGRATGLDIPNERNGLLPSRSWKRRVRKEEWYPGETLNIGIGQGYWLVTPLQLAQATARLAMRGGGFKPHLLRATEDTVTRTVTAVLPEPLPPMGNRDPHTYDTVISAMVAVTSPGGTAARIGAKAPYSIAGKTGTSQVAGLAQGESAPDLKDTPKHLRDHAWFMGFAPAESPRIAVAVLAEHAGHGGAVAAPIARQVMDQYLLGKVLFATDALPATTNAAAPTRTEAATPTATSTSAMSPADAIDATNPEEGFLAPPATLPRRADQPSTAAPAPAAANPPRPSP